MIVLSLRQISKAEEEIPIEVTTNQYFGLVSRPTKSERALSTRLQPRGLDKLGFKARYEMQKGLFCFDWVVG